MVVTTSLELQAYRACVITCATLCLLAPVRAVGQEPRVRVPDVRGVQLSDAEGILAHNGLVAGPIERKPSERPEGTIIDQFPAPDSLVAWGTGIALVVAEPQLRHDARDTVRVVNPGLLLEPMLPTPTDTIHMVDPNLLFVRVPDVVGKTVTEAQEVVARRGLVLRPSGERLSEEPTNTVIEQSPSEGLPLPRGGSVAVILSRQAVVVPKVIGLTLASAEDSLRQHGLRANPVIERPSRALIGTVIDQTPKPGTRLDTLNPDQHQAVALVVAIPEQVRVPNLIGMSTGIAMDTLANSGLNRGQITIRGSTRPLDTVIEQQPLAGRLVLIGDTVSMVISNPERVLVPYLVGTTVNAAARRLETVGLKIGRQARRPSVKSEGSIIEQFPDSGKEVERGSVVDITLAIPTLVVVPNLTGFTLDRARNSIAEDGLRVGRIAGAFVVPSEPTVASQNPTAGAQVPPGTAVNLVLKTMTVSVPEITGRPVPEARKILAGVGLRLDLAPNFDWADSMRLTIATQDPAARAIIPVGTAIVVTPRSDGVPWILILSAVILVAGGFLAHRFFRDNRPKPQPTISQMAVNPIMGALSTKVHSPEKAVGLEVRLRSRKSEMRHHVRLAEKGILRERRVEQIRHEHKGQVDGD